MASGRHHGWLRQGMVQLDEQALSFNMGGQVFGLSTVATPNLVRFYAGRDASGQDVWGVVMVWARDVGGSSRVVWNVVGLGLQSGMVWAQAEAWGLGGEQLFPPLLPAGVSDMDQRRPALQSLWVEDRVVLVAVWIEDHEQEEVAQLVLAIADSSTNFAWESRQLYIDTEGDLYRLDRPSLYVYHDEASGIIGGGVAFERQDRDDDRVDNIYFLSFAADASADPVTASSFTVLPSPRLLSVSAADSQTSSFESLRFRASDPCLHGSGDTMWAVWYVGKLATSTDNVLGMIPIKNGGRDDPSFGDPVGLEYFPARDFEVTDGGGNPVLVSNDPSIRFAEDGFMYLCFGGYYSTFFRPPLEPRRARLLRCAAPDPAASLATLEQASTYPFRLPVDAAGQVLYEAQDGSFCSLAVSGAGKVALAWKFEEEENPPFGAVDPDGWLDELGRRVRPALAGVGDPGGSRIGLMLSLDSLETVVDDARAWLMPGADLDTTTTGVFDREQPFGSFRARVILSDNFLDVLWERHNMANEQAELWYWWRWFT